MIIQDELIIEMFELKLNFLITERNPSDKIV